MAKGADYERLLCKTISQWYSKVGDDDLFWRTHGSGARATSRTKKGKKTRGQYGDMCATDGRGKKLLRVAVFSFKRGYRNTTIGDLLDRTERGREPQFATWVREAKRDANDAGVPYWILILKRDRKQDLIFMDINLKLDLSHAGARSLNKVKPQVSCVADVHKDKPLTRKEIKVHKKSGTYIEDFVLHHAAIFGCLLEDFLGEVTRAHIDHVAERLE